MSGHDVTDPIGAVSGVKANKAPQGPEQPAGAGNGKSSFMFETNYVLEVMKYTNIAMQHQASIVSMRGDLAELGTKIASDLATISEFISKIQAEAHSGGEVDSLLNLGDGSFLDFAYYATPDSFSGLSNDFYSISESGKGDGSNTMGSDNVAGCVDPTYADSMKGFIAAVKDLFYSSSSGSGITVADISTIANPADSSKNFDMLSYFKQISDPNDPDSFAKYSGSGFDVVSTNPKMHPSLLQQYMYAKAKLTVNTTPQDQLKAANGDISKLVDFDPDDSHGGTIDSDLSPFLQVLDGLNTNVSVKNSASDTVHSWLSNKTSETVLQMILQNRLYNWKGSGDNISYNLQDTDLGANVGLYGAFSYMAYNYIWTKNPNMDTSQASGNDPYPLKNLNIQEAHGDWNANGYKGIPQGDPLSALSGNVSSTQTNFNSATSATGTSFQQDVNSVQQVDGAAGKIIDGFSQGQETLVRNFKS